jgi:hypothetical protein
MVNNLLRKHRGRLKNLPLFFYRDAWYSAVKSFKIVFTKEFAMKKIVVCMSLICVVSMQASEKRNQKNELTNLDQVRSALRKEHEDHQKNRGADYLKGLEIKRNRIHSEKSITEDKK